MEYELITQNEQAYLECLPGSGQIESERDALDVVAACGENEVHRLMVHDENLPPAFYDLRTGLAGVVLLKFTTYSIKLAAVIPPERIGSSRFSEMVREVNRRDRSFHVFSSRAEAEAWLVAD